jgi:cell wall-associated NlpC family hydrolase
LKRIASLFFLVLFFTACKPTSAIITSKKEAEDKGIYTVPVAKKAVAKKETHSKAVAKKETVKKSKIIEVEASDYVLNTADSSYLVEQLINSASSKIGANYRSGGITDEGFDCSGLMYNIFELYHIKLPHSSLEQSKLGAVVERENIKKGDLIFFRTNGRKQINHVGMVFEVTADEIKFIHSATSSGVIVSSTKEPYYQKSFAQVNRILL